MSPQHRKAISDGMKRKWRARKAARKPVLRIDVQRAKEAAFARAVAEAVLLGMRLFR